jgi:hypothetical protein
VLSHEYDLLINYISIIKLKEKFDIKAIFIVKKYAKWNSNVLLWLRASPRVPVIFSLKLIFEGSLNKIGA